MTNSEVSMAEAEPTPQLGPYGVTVTQAIRLPELSEFRADERVRKKLFEGAQLWGELLCFEAEPLQAIIIRRRMSFS